MDPPSDGSIKDTKLTDPELMGRLGAPGDRPFQRVAIACHIDGLVSQLLHRAVNLAQVERINDLEIVEERRSWIERERPGPAGHTQSSARLRARCFESLALRHYGQPLCLVQKLMPPAVQQTQPAFEHGFALLHGT